MTKGKNKRIDLNSISDEEIKELIDYQLKDIETANDIIKIKDKPWTLDISLPHIGVATPYNPSSPYPNNPSTSSYVNNVTNNPYINVNSSRIFYSDSFSDRINKSKTICSLFNDGNKYESFFDFSVNRNVLENIFRNIECYFNNMSDYSVIRPDSDLKKYTLDLFTALLGAIANPMVTKSDLYELLKRMNDHYLSDESL